MSNKLGRYRKGVKSNQVTKYGDYRKITAKYDGTCCICREGYSEGMDVLWNKDAEPGRKMSHVSCYLRREE